METPTRFMRDGQELDSNGKAIEQSKPKQAAAAEPKTEKPKPAAPPQTQPKAKPAAVADKPTEDKPAASTEKTGDLPHNITGAGKLKAGNITTWEELRAAAPDQLLALGLDADQVVKLRDLAAPAISE